MLGKIVPKLRGGILFCIKWRYIIALFAFIFCVVFKIHGSSIGEYNLMFENSAEYNSEQNLFGKSRSIRSDEWLVHTPYYMSQQYNDFNKDSNMMSLEGQDMIVGYNAPVTDITVVAKPFTWGYILLGNEYGLSWYWCSKLILLMLVSFELCMIITRKNKKISLLGTLLIAFAPTVQWWFVPHMVDVFFWVMAVLVLAYHFFTSEKWLRILCMILLPLAATTFVLALFPSLQLSLGLVMIALFVALLIRDKDQITFKKKDIWRLAIIASIFAGILGYTMITSKDAITSLYSTVYPGNRATLGGKNTFKVLFTDLTTFSLPYKDITYSNNCEVSTFIHFTPLLLMLYPFIRKKFKKDKNIIVGDTLLVCIIVMATFMIAGFPELLAKVTGFSYINRMNIAYGLVATIFTIWGLSMIWRKRIFTNKQIWLVLAIYAACYVMFIGANELSYHSWRYYIVAILGVTTLGYLMLNNHKKLFILGTTILIAISSFAINPIATGNVSLLGHPLEQKVNEIAKSDPEAYWLALEDTRLASIGIANGARTLNATNFYPDYGKWSLIDPDKANDYFYNRYAHINVKLVDEETKFLSGDSGDFLNLEISYNDLSKWPVKYLLTKEKLGKNHKEFTEIYQDTEGSYYIYERSTK